MGLALAAFGELRAAAEPTSLTGAYSEYETIAINDAEKKLGLHVDGSPEGKIIERIDFVRIDPVDEHDPLPRALDYAHTTSKAFVIRRNLLVAEGQRWRTVLVDESARNLRKLRQLSLVVCVAMAGSQPDRVRLVVITKDVWSLYVDFDLAVTSGGLEQLTLEPKESNLAGIHHEATGRFILEPKTMSFGGAYRVPRLEGRWLSVDVDMNAVVNRDSGALEGGYGSVMAERPLFSSRTEWAWSSTTKFANQLKRRYVNAEVASFTPSYVDHASATPAELVPWMWRERSVHQEVKVTRSFGWETKNDVSLGGAFSHADYRAPAIGADGTVLDPRAVAELTKAAVPVGENRVGPFVQWHSYRSDFLRTYDLDSLGLQEDHRLGHDVYVRAYPLAHALGSTRDLIGVYGGASYGIALGRDGIVRAAVESTVETQLDPSSSSLPDAARNRRVTDASVTGSFAIATPRFGPSVFKGRLIFATTALSRTENYLNAQSFLGGDTLLRGYPSRYLAGKDLVATNIEYRTRSFDLAAIQVGGGLFYDVGDAWSSGHLDPKQSVGGGLRIVFPQIDRTVLRVDVGVPVSAEPRPSDVPPVSVFIAFHHAVSLPSIGNGL